MPSENSIKIYKEEGFYHAYNRGVNKELIYKAESDLEDFLYLLSEYLEKPDGKHRRKNYYKKVKLICFCLMPNHFHLLLQQVSKYDVSEFITSLCISYAMRFNKKHKRVGHLFQDKFKARLIEKEEDLINVSKYIHTNPKEIDSEWFIYRFSSICDYTKHKRRHSFVNRNEILGFFGRKRKSYIDYVLDRI